MGTTKARKAEVYDHRMCVRLFFAASMTTFCTPALARSSGGGSLVLFGIIGLVVAYMIFASMVASGVAKELERRKSEIEAKERQERLLTTQNAENERTKTEALFRAQQATITSAMNALNTSFIQGRQWLAEYIAEAFRAPDIAAAKALENKKHPAHKAADEVRRIAIEKKELVQRVKELEYVLKTYHEYYPVLEQYHEDILNEDATLILDDEDEETDRVSRYISKEEYERLPAVQRNQRALDNWRARRKSNVEVGRMFERYLGYLYEHDGWTVTYFGAIQGLEDMGRDLLCIKGSTLHVVQAKYWAKHKIIHEKHIFQLYGTTILLPLTRPDLKGTRITPVFAATTSLSPTAKFAAEQLGVSVRQLDMEMDYPLIKCNINGRNKIYHLPFDQQYDRVRIDPARGECYVKTVAEAEKLGFRRAMRHRARA